MSPSSSRYILELVLPLGKRMGSCASAAAALLIVFLTFSIMQPTAPDIRVRLLVGWLLMSGGFSRFIAALKGGGTRHLMFQMLIGSACLIGAVYCFTHPVFTLISVVFPCRKFMAWSQE